MQTTSIKLDLMPLQVAHLRGSEAVTIGDQDHGCIAMTVPIALGGFDQALDLALGEIAAATVKFSMSGVLASAVCFVMRKTFRVSMTGKIIALFCHSQQRYLSFVSQRRRNHSVKFFSRGFFNWVRCIPVGPRRREGADGSRSLCASSTHARNRAMGPES